MQFRTYEDADGNGICMIQECWQECRIPNSYFGSRDGASGWTWATLDSFVDRMNLALCTAEIGRRSYGMA